MSTRMSSIDALLEMAAQRIGDVPAHVQPDIPEHLLGDDDVSQAAEAAPPEEDPNDSMTLEDLYEFDPTEKDVKSVSYMPARMLKREYSLHGVLVPKHNSQVKLGKRVQGLRDKAKKVQALDKEKVEKEAMFAGADYDEAHEHEVADEECRIVRRQFGVSEYLRLILVMVLPINANALTKYATGFETTERKRKREELDDRPAFDPWQGAFKDAFNAVSILVTHPCPQHDTIGLNFADPNKATLGWTGDQLKGFASKMRSQISLVMVDWTASGNYDVENLPNFCEPSTEKRRNLSIPPKCLRVSRPSCLIYVAPFPPTDCRCSAAYDHVHCRQAEPRSVSQDNARLQRD